MQASYHLLHIPRIPRLGLATWHAATAAVAYYMVTVHFILLIRFLPGTHQSPLGLVRAQGKLGR